MVLFKIAATTITIKVLKSVCVCVRVRIIMPWKLSEKNMRLRGGSIGRTRLEPFCGHYMLLTNTYDIMAPLLDLVFLLAWSIHRTKCVEQQLKRSKMTEQPTQVNARALSIVCVCVVSTLYMGSLVERQLFRAYAYTLYQL